MLRGLVGQAGQPVGVAGGLVHRDGAPWQHLALQPGLAERAFAEMRIDGAEHGVAHRIDGERLAAVVLEIDRDHEHALRAHRQRGRDRQRLHAAGNGAIQRKHAAFGIAAHAHPAAAGQRGRPAAEAQLVPALRGVQEMARLRAPVRIVLDADLELAFQHHRLAGGMGGNGGLQQEQGRQRREGGGRAMEHAGQGHGDTGGEQGMPAPPVGAHAPGIGGSRGASLCRPVRPRGRRHGRAHHGVRPRASPRTGSQIECAATAEWGRSPQSMNSVKPVPARDGRCARRCSSR